jgi:hypothetical protein
VCIEDLEMTFLVMSATRLENPDASFGSPNAERNWCALYFDDMVNGAGRWVQDGCLSQSRHISCHYLSVLSMSKDGIQTGPSEKTLLVNLA